MPRTNAEVWSWAVFAISVGAYIPLAIGGWLHQKELNIACYSIWLILALMMVFGSFKQGFAGWRMPLGWTLGNGSLVIFSLAIGGYTFNLGPAETIVIYGIIGTLALFVAVGTMTKKWNPRILLLGSIAADVLSFYPQMKQYLQPHEPATWLMISGWWLFLLAALANAFFVEEFAKKLLMGEAEYVIAYGRAKNTCRIIEESLLSLENSSLIFVTIVVMTR
ncbi:MAG: hypothetical protein AAB897_02545 [Patescibacteria group bacterium]